MNHPPRRRAATAAALVLLGGLLAGCGTPAGTAAAPPAGSGAGAPIGGGGDVASFCDLLQQRADALVHQALAQRSRNDPRAPAPDPRTLAGSHLEQWRPVIDAAPAEIQPDIQRVADAMARVADGANPVAVMSDPAVQASERRYSQYARTHCPALQPGHP